MIIRWPVFQTGWQWRENNWWSNGFPPAPWALRHRNAVDTVERNRCIFERLTHDRSDELEVTPRRDLRDDPAVPRMERGLRGDDRRADLPCLGDHGRGGLVARSLDREDHDTACSRSSAVDGSRHMMSASSRLSV